MTLERLLQWLLPKELASDVFDPARRDLMQLHLLELTDAQSAAARRFCSIRHEARLVLLFLDCWRLAIVGLHGRTHQLPASSAIKSRRRSVMFLHSMRQSFTRLRREPAFTIAAVLTLALGVGANVAVFAVVEAVLLRPLPYEDADELVIVRHRDQRTGISKDFIAIGDHVDIAARQSALDAFAAYGAYQTTIYGAGEPLQVGGLSAAPEIFTALRVRPAVGRVFEPDDAREGAAPVAMLGYNLWQEQFAGDVAVVGRSLRIGRTVRTIVGIAPRGFNFPPTADADVITPIGIPLVAPAQRKAGWTFAVARLKPGQTAGSASAHLAGIAQQLEQEHPEQNQASTYYATPLRDALVGNTKQALVLMLCAVGFVLLIACANVANLQLARSLARRRETAVRLALGAGRGQVVGQFLSESLALALIASTAGIAFAYWGVRALVSLVPESVSVPGLADVRLNGVVLAFALAIAAGSALVFGFLAAGTVRLQNATDVLVSAGRATMSRMMRRATSALVVAEVALAIVLLVGAGLILRSFSSLLSVDPGFGYQNVLTMEIRIPAGAYTEAEARAGFYDRAFEAMRALPGVEAVGAAVVVPLTGNNWTVPFERFDQPVAAGERPPDVGWQAASGGFFQALQIPLIEGRLFDARDRPGAQPVVIISEAIQQRFFAGENAVGRQLKLGDGTAEIVGVVGNIRRAGLDDEPRADMYLPFESNPSGQITLFVRTRAEPALVVDGVRSALRVIEPSTAVLGTRTLAEIASESIRVTQLVLWLLGVFATLALVLAAVGIYGVMAYAVRQRTREIGTRMAVGATRPDILWLVMRQGALVGGLGIGAGLLIGLAATRSLRSVLFGVSATDPLTLLVATAVLLLTTLLACYIPARRASAVDPARTLSQP